MEVIHVQSLHCVKLGGIAQSATVTGNQLMDDLKVYLPSALRLVFREVRYF